MLTSSGDHTLRSSECRKLQQLIGRGTSYSDLKKPRVVVSKIS